MNSPGKRLPKPVPQKRTVELRHIELSANSRNVAVQLHHRIGGAKPHRVIRLSAHLGRGSFSAKQIHANVVGLIKEHSVRQKISESLINMANRGEIPELERITIVESKRGKDATIFSHTHLDTKKGNPKDVGLKLKTQIELLSRTPAETIELLDSLWKKINSELKKELKKIGFEPKSMATQLKKDRQAIKQFTTGKGSLNPRNWGPHS